MSRPTLSLVMPVYNVEAYLAACLDSIVAQTRQPDEIIVVDDGATDHCPEILAAYQNSLPQMRIVRQANAGLSAARNTGLQHATGEWLVFLDSDDRLAPNHCEMALGMAQQDNLDIALFNGWFDFEGRRPEQLIYPDEPTTGVMSGSDWLRGRLQRRCFFHMVWLHLYRREFVERAGLRFVPPWIHEDVQWTTRALVAAQRVRYDAVPLIHYRKPLRPMIQGPATDARLAFLIESSAFNAKELNRVCDSVSDPALSRLIAWQLVDGGLSIFHHIAKISTAATRRAVYRKLRSDDVYRLLWRHATGFAQHRRIARNWIKSWL